MADLRNIVNGVTSSLDAAAIINENAAELASRVGAAQAKADAAIPTIQKGEPNGVAGLNANRHITARQEGVTLPSFRVALPSGSSALRYATSGDLASLKHNANETTQVYGQFKTARPNTSGTMLALDFRGQRLGSAGGSVGLNCTVHLYVLTAINQVNCFVNHRGDWRPTVLAGINSLGELCIIFDANNANSGAGFFLISLADARVGHVGAINGYEWMANWSGSTLVDLSSFSVAPFILPDSGPLPAQGGTLTGPLRLPLGTSVSPILRVGTDLTGISSRAADGDLTFTIGATPRMSIVTNQTRIMGELGWSSAITTVADVTLSRIAANTLAIGASAGTTFSGAASVGGTTGGGAGPLIMQGGLGGSIQHERSAAGQLDIDDFGPDNTFSSTVRFGRNTQSSAFEVQIHSGKGGGTSSPAHTVFRHTATSVPHAELALGGNGLVGIGGPVTAGKAARIYGDTQVDGAMFLQAMTRSTVPPPSAYQNAAIVVTDAVGGRCIALSNGTNWISQLTGNAV